MSVVEIESPEQLQNLIEGEGRLVCINFTAKWCGPCRKIAPMIEKFAASEKEKIIIAKVCIGDL